MQVEYASIAYAIVIVAIIIIFNKKKSRFPPGPRGLPYFGHVFSFNKTTVHKLKEFHTKYGKTFHLKMAGNDVIM